MYLYAAFVRRGLTGEFSEAVTPMTCFQCALSAQDFGLELFGFPFGELAEGQKPDAGMPLDGRSEASNEVFGMQFQIGTGGLWYELDGFL